MARYPKLLGIDFGKKHLGLAVAEGPLSQPLGQIEIIGEDHFMAELLRTVEREKPEKIIVGISEGEMAEKTKTFCRLLETNIKDIPIELQDEALSTFDAQAMSIAAGMGPKKRKEMEHAFAASVILQRYIDSH